MATVAQPSWATNDAEPSSSTSTSKQSSPGGQWPALNVTPDIARSLLLRGFKSPTPIQRASIPSSLSNPPRDILGMARTGSGKTLAYLIPLLQRLGSKHTPAIGPRSLIICPNRELAVQILKVGKDLARGLKKSKSKEREGLHWALIIGGERLDEQFEAMTNNPDIVIATPGRFLHLVVEMHLDLRHVQMVIYDEADRLFEMGFDAQLREILHRLPSTRQNLLFSATLPSSVAEFAKAGLVNPLLVRLDVENKISPDLDLRFFFTKPSEKEASLLVLLNDIIRLHSGSPKGDKAPQAIVFTSTKHHVDYLADLLRNTGYQVSYIYSSLDQTARHQQLNHFRNGLTNVLVVTDIAARGLDIPVMDHVVNYDFPPGPRVFVHRVGRTARAGRKGTAWSLVTRDDLPYLIDLQTFLGPTRLSADTGILKTLPDDATSSAMEYIATGVSQDAPQIAALHHIMLKGQAMYERSRGKASPSAYKEAKSLGRRLSHQVNELSTPPTSSAVDDSSNDADITGRAHLLSSLATYTPAETVFEIGRRGESAGASIMKKRRLTIEKRHVNKAERQSEALDINDTYQAREQIKSFRDPAFYVSHHQVGANDEKGLSLRSGASIPDSLSAAAMDLHSDEGASIKAQKASQISWDRKKRKFVQKPGNADGIATIKTESGTLLPASYSSGRFNEWKAKRQGQPSSHKAGGQSKPKQHLTNWRGKRDSTAAVRPYRGAKVPASSMRKSKGAAGLLTSAGSQKRNSSSESRLKKRSRA